MPGDRLQQAIDAVMRGDHAALRALRLTRDELIELRGSVRWGYAAPARMEGVVAELLADARAADTDAATERAVRLARWAVWVAIVSTLVTAVGVWRTWGASPPSDCRCYGVSSEVSFASSPRT
jgi:hypothetical protein